MSIYLWIVQLYKNNIEIFNIIGFLIGAVSLLLYFRRDRKKDKILNNTERTKQLLTTNTETIKSLESKFSSLEKVVEGSIKDKNEDDAAINSLREHAAEARDKGHFGEAESLFREAMNRALTSAAALKETEHKKLRSAAESSALAARTAALQPSPTSYRKAAEYYAEAADIVASVDAQAASQYREQQADMLYRLGNEFGDNDALREAIRDYQKILSTR